MEQLLECFLRYVAVESQSKPQARQVPSSEGQWTLARQLQEELIALGFVDVTLSDHCCVYIARMVQTLPSGTRCSGLACGLCPPPVEKAEALVSGREGVTRQKTSNRCLPVLRAAPVMMGRPAHRQNLPVPTPDCARERPAHPDGCR